jgi:hypothetical protein
MSSLRTAVVLLGSWLSLGALATFVSACFSLSVVACGSLSLEHVLATMGGSALIYALGGAILKAGHLR